MEKDYYRDEINEDISMGEVALICYETILKKDVLNRIIISTILTLHLKKHIKFEKSENQDGVIILLQDSKEKLKKSEEVVLDALKKSDIEKDKKLTLNEITNQNNTIFIKNRKEIKDAIVEEAIEDGILDEKKLALKQKYFEKEEKFAAIALFIPLMICFATNSLYPISLEIITMPIGLIGGFIYAKKSRNINMYTEEASIQKRRLEGLRKYLEDFSLIKDRDILEIYLWEKYLAYSTVFNINKNILNILKINLNYQQVDNNIYFDRFEDKYYYFDSQTGEKKYIPKEEEEKIKVDPDNRRLYFLDENGMKRYL